MCDGIRFVLLLINHESSLLSTHCWQKGSFCRILFCFLKSYMTYSKMTFGRFSCAPPLPTSVWMQLVSLWVSACFLLWRTVTGGLHTGDTQHFIHTVMPLHNSWKVETSQFLYDKHGACLTCLDLCAQQTVQLPVNNQCHSSEYLTILCSTACCRRWSP